MALVAYDQSLRSLEQALLTVVDEIIELEENNQRGVKTAQKMHEATRTLRKDVDAKELQMKEIEVQVALVKVKMQSVANAREYEMARKELERVHEIRNTVEDELLAVWNTLDNAQKAGVKDDKVACDQAVNADRLLAEKKEKKIQLEAELFQKDTERSSYEKDIPTQWLADYARIKRSFSDPVVSVENGSCSACYESLSGQQLSDLARKQLYPCPGCFRFLYNKP